MEEEKGLIPNNKLPDGYWSAGTAGVIKYLINYFPATGIPYAFFEGAGTTFEADKKQVAVDFGAFIEKHPEIINERLANDPVFVNGLLKTIEFHARQKDQEKLRIAKAVFLNFSRVSEEERKRFSLDRLYSTLNAVSIETIEYLRFMRQIVPPLIDKEPKIGIEEEKYDRGPLGWVKYCTKDHSPVSKYLESYLHNEYDPNSQKVKERHNYNPETDKDRVLLDHIYEIKDVEVTRMNEALAELISLGICLSGVSGGGGIGGGGGSRHVTFTQYGVRFIAYLLSAEEI